MHTSVCVSGRKDPRIPSQPDNKGKTLGANTFCLARFHASPCLLITLTTNTLWPAKLTTKAVSQPSLNPRVMILIEDGPQISGHNQYGGGQDLSSESDRISLDRKLTADGQQVPQNYYGGPQEHAIAPNQPGGPGGNPGGGAFQYNQQ